MYPADTFISAADYDEAAVAAYEAAGSSQDDRRRAQFAATGNPELEARVDAVDLRRESEVLRTIMQAATRGLGWEGNRVDVANLHRMLRRHGVAP